MCTNAQVAVYDMCYFTLSAIISTCSRLQPSLQLTATSTTIQKKKKEKAFHTELPGTKSDQRRLPEQPCIVSGPLHVKQLRSLFSLCMCCILLLHAMRAEVSRLRDCARDPRWMAARQEDCLCLRTEKVLCSQPLPSPSPCCCIRPTHTAPPPPKLKNYPEFHEAGDHTLLPCKRSNRAI